MYKNSLALFSQRIKDFLKILSKNLALIFTIFCLQLASLVNAQPIPIAVGMDPTFVAFFVAKEKKLFEKYGLDVNLLSFGPGGSMVDGLVAGQAVISASTETTNIARMGRSPDLIAIGIVGESGDNLKLVAKKKINTPTEIKTMGVVPGGVFEYLNHLTFTKYGIDPSSIKIVKSGPPELPALLARGDIDAFWIFEPFASMAQQHGAHLLARSNEVGYSYNFWILASASWFEKNKAEAKKVLQALNEACELTTENPQEAAKAVHAQVKIPIDQTLEFLNETQCKVRSFSEDDLANYESISDFLDSINITPTRVDVRKQIINEFAEHY